MSVIRHISFTSIPVLNQDRAIEFYRGFLNFQLLIDAPYEEGWRWIFMGLPEMETRLHFAKPDELAWKEGLPVLSLICDDVDQLAQEFSEDGVPIVNGPGDAPWNAERRWLLINDSEGNLVMLESRK